MIKQNEDFKGWMDEDWKMQAEEELRAGVDALTSADDGRAIARTHAQPDARAHDGDAVAAAQL